MNKKMANRIIKIVVLLLLLLGVYKYSSSSADIPDGENSSLLAVQEIEKAREEGQSMWLLFRSATCPPCVEMQKIFDRLEPEYEDKMAFISIDVNDEKNLDLVRHYEIQYIPVTVIYDSEGNISYQQVGLVPLELLKNELDKVAE